MLDGFLNRKKENRSGPQDALSAYIDGELTTRQRAKLEKELSQDPDLRKELEELRRTSQMLRSLPTLSVPRSFTLDPAVYGRVKPRRLYLYPVMRAATVVAMLVFAFLFAGDLFYEAGIGMPAIAPNAEMIASEFTREVEKEVVVTAMEQLADEVAEEAPMAVMAETVEEEAEIRQLEVPAEAVGETVVEEMAVESEAELAPTAEMQTTELAETDATAPPAAEPAEGGVSAGGASPTITATPGPAPTLSPTEVVSHAAAPTAPPTYGILPTISPTEPVAAPVTEEAAKLMPAGEDAPELTGAIEEMEPDRGGDAGIDWGLISKLGMGVLAAGLLIVTLMARRYNW